MPKLNPEYDPDWERRFDRALDRANSTHTSEDVAAMHRAFWSQFRTMAEIRDFHFDSLRTKARISNLEVVLPDLDEDCTWDEIAAAYGHGDNAINDYLADGNRRRYAHPIGLNAFSGDSENVHRVSERYEYTGFWNTPSACVLTVEYQEKEAYVCFTLIENGGTSPINMIEDLATVVYHEHLVDRYSHEEVHWYAYFRFRGYTGREGFMEAILGWDRRKKRYISPTWNHFESVPQVIGDSADMGSPAPGIPRVIPRSDSTAPEA